MELTVIGVESYHNEEFSKYGLNIGAAGKLICFSNCKFINCTGTIKGTFVEFNDCTFTNTFFEFVVKTNVSFNGCEGTLSLI